MIIVGMGMPSCRTAGHTSECLSTHHDGAVPASAVPLTLKRSGSGSGFGGRLATLISSHDFSFRVRVRIWAASRMDPKVMVWKNGIVFEYLILYLNEIPIGKFPYRQNPYRQIPYRQNP